jgi:hypothetical protein
MLEIVEKLELSVKNLKDKNFKIYFFVQDTRGNANASVRYIYQLALSLKQKGFNSMILHEKSDYVGVSNWLSTEYMNELPHTAVEGTNLQISPEDVVVIPELFGYVMPQLTNLPCFKMIVCQSYDYIFETLQAGQSWAQLGFTKCITTSEKMKEYISSNMKNVSIEVINPIISESFSPYKLPQKPIIGVHTREQRDTANLIKSFYNKFPQYRWISFKDLRGLSEQEFANSLKECMLSVWIDPTSSFGTFPLESMKCGVPVLGKVPNMSPEWINEDNGLWINDTLIFQDVVADFIQNWMEDNISEKIYNESLKTSEKYSDKTKLENEISELFEKYISNRVSIFNEEINKLKNNEQLV